MLCWQRACLKMAPASSRLDRHQLHLPGPRRGHLRKQHTPLPALALTAACSPSCLSVNCLTGGTHPLISLMGIPWRGSRREDDRRGQAPREEQEAVPPIGFTSPLQGSSWPGRKIKTQHCLSKNQILPVSIAGACSTHSLTEPSLCALACLASSQNVF